MSSSVSGKRLVLFLPSLAGGGAERVFVELANQFAADGIHVDLALAAAEGPFLAEVGPGVRLVDLRARGVLRALPGLARHLRRERPAAILSALDHANIVSISAGLLARSGTRRVISMRGAPTMLGREWARTATRVLRCARVAYRFADAVIANSAGVADDVAAHLRLDRARIQVVYNPLDIDSIAALAVAPLTHPLAAPGGPPLLLSAGRMSALKDFPTLLRAFALLRAQRECRLAILGEGLDCAELRTLIDDLGIAADVALPGFDPNPFAWMRCAAVFVSSSLSEGCPNALMQALACGTPVVSTNAIGGSAEILAAGKWGRLTPVGDPRALADAVAATLDAREQPDVRLRARDFALPKIARQYLGILMPGEFGSGAV